MGVDGGCGGDIPKVEQIWPMCIIFSLFLAITPPPPHVDSGSILLPAT